MTGWWWEWRTGCKSAANKPMKPTVTFGGRSLRQGVGYNKERHERPILQGHPRLSSRPLAGGAGSRQPNLALDGLQKGNFVMPKDKSLLYYGAIYHKLFDSQLAEARQITVDLIAEGSSVLDIGCGTGLLCFSLKEQKHCRVVGLDLSLRMLEFARKCSPFEDVVFVHEDATDLRAFGDHSFDYATMLMIMHELPRSQQVRVLTEALRVANKCIIIDSVVPLPKNAGGIGIRIVEATFGRDHNRNFKAFLAGGGIHGMLEGAGLPINVEHSSVFWRNCREAVVISRHQ